MLTENEKIWLKCRKKSYKYYCMWCDLQCDEHGANPFCPTTKRKEKFADAAEFSERVAAKLADAYWPPLVYTPVAPFEQIFMPPMDRLRCARITVEEEMDA